MASIFLGYDGIGDILLFICARVGGHKYIYILSCRSRNCSRHSSFIVNYHDV